MKPFSELWRDGKPSISFEFYPARTEKGEAKLQETIDDLLGLSPDFASVTFGAGGSSREGSAQLLRSLLARNKTLVIGYLAAFGLAPADLKAVIDDYAAAGAASIFCVRGDEPEVEGFIPAHDCLPHAADLVCLARQNCPLPLGVAGYPEGHVEAKDRESDWRFLGEKVSRGASYVISQYFYDNRYFYEFRDHCRKTGVTVPILAGVMPIYSAKLTRSLAGRCGAALTGEIEAAFACIDPEDKAGLEAFGVDLAVRQCRDLLAQGVDGLHFYTMDRSTSIRAILDRLKL